MPNYAQYLFLQNEQAEELLKMIDKLGPAHVINHLIDDFVPMSDPEVFLCSPWGESDTIYKHHSWILNYNTRLTYVGLCQKCDD